MFKQISLTDLLFLDIETVPAESHFHQLPAIMQELWMEKLSKTKPESEMSAADAYANRAGIYAEFGKIICISMGFFYYLPYDGINKRLQLRVTSFSGDDETQVLNGFFGVIERLNNKDTLKFVGHNIQEFDLPYICRRAIILGLELPEKLQWYGKKPWEVPVIDTLHLWRFGDHKHYISLQLLTTVLGIASPKEDMRGSEVASIYWQEHDLERIAQYCQKDVVAVAQLLLRLRHEPLLAEDQIEYIRQIPIK
ncbi:MAG: ribonuclease H-like domain-containing protein [Thermoflavifilum sp.]|nr:ribonuclease H-like domain-containing protein [Thermoflavifilum sp.]